MLHLIYAEVWQGGCYIYFLTTVKGVDHCPVE